MKSGWKGRNNVSKRIVFFIGTLLEGGAERVISILSEYLLEYKYDIRILMFYDREVFYRINPQVGIDSVEKEAKGNLIKKTKWIRRYFLDNADVVISFLSPLNMLAITALLGSKKPIIVADRSDPSKTPEKSILRVFRNFLYRFSSKVVVQTTQNYRYFSSRVRNKTIVIPNPVDMKGMVGAALKTEKRKRIVSVGRLIPPKNQTLLIEAFNIISKEYPEYSLTIYGEGESRRELESFTHEFGISDRVEFPGSKQNIHELLSDASLFVLPSLYEGMPNALIEAMSLGLPCISTLVSGADDLIQNNYNGLIVKNNDLEDMISGIRMMLTSDMLRNTCAKNATKIVEKLEPERITSEWESVIRVLLQ